MNCSNMKRSLIIILFLIGSFPTLKSQTIDNVQIDCFQFVFKGEIHNGYVNLIVIGDNIYAGEALADYNLDCFRNKKINDDFKEIERKSVSDVLRLNMLLSSSPEYFLDSLIVGINSTESIGVKAISFRGKFHEIECDIVKTYPFKAELSNQSVFLYDIDFHSVVELESISSDNTFFKLVTQKSKCLMKYARTGQFWQFGGM